MVLIISLKLTEMLHGILVILTETLVSLETHWWVLLKIFVC